GRGAIRVIDGSGMSDTNGDHIADTHASTNYGENASWISDLAANSPIDEQWLAIDLGQMYNLDHMDVFNFNANNSAAHTDRGVGQADIYVSLADAPDMTSPDFSDTSLWELVATDVLFNEATGPYTDGSGTPYNTPDSIDLEGFAGRWIALDIDANLGDSNFVGLGEILVFPAAATSAVPEPSSVALLILGTLGLGCIARRRRRR
ncbi:MAG: PEP-CTERM sorting domain-containing protein, partial [Planctomycetes bacterium]|nr:PEP-CTERM sorting domain-containing protein [Planctomycetota bacterium]